jgi:hypothetical protein
MRALVLLAALAIVPLGACHHGSATPTDASGAGGGAGTGGTGGTAGTSGTGFWSCGTAAGLCTCVRIDVDPGSAPHTCAASDCCFTDANGRCTCRLPTAIPDCQAAMTSLAATARVSACPN